jgi:hypothetical protein
VSAVEENRPAEPPFSAPGGCWAIRAARHAVTRSGAADPLLVTVMEPGSSAAVPGSSAEQPDDAMTSPARALRQRTMAPPSRHGAAALAMLALLLAGLLGAAWLFSSVAIRVAATLAAFLLVHVVLDQQQGGAQREEAARAAHAQGQHLHQMHQEKEQLAAAPKMPATVDTSMQPAQPASIKCPPPIAAVAATAHEEKAAAATANSSASVPPSAQQHQQETTETCASPEDLQAQQVRSAQAALAQQRLKKLQADQAQEQQQEPSLKKPVPVGPRVDKSLGSLTGLAELMNKMQEFMWNSAALQQV